MNKIKNIFLRYLLILLVALPNLFIFYLIFTPLTIYPLFVLFKLSFAKVLLSKSSFFILDGFQIDIIKACVAGSAYYLLFILNVSVPKIKFKKRIKMLLFSFAFFLILNIIRIFALTLIFVSGSSSFESLHKIFWYAGATIFVVLIWFFEVKIFKIKKKKKYLNFFFFIYKYFI